MMKRNTTITIILAVLAVVIISTVSGIYFNENPTSPKTSTIRVVAAENFWGSLASQIGGKYVNVTSIITDPNADPHEFESNTTVARDIAEANFVIVNGVGYDTWALSLISANPSSSRTVLNVGDLVGVPNGGNPHLWYNPTFVNKTVNQIYLDLVSIAKEDKQYFQQQYSTMNTSLAHLYGEVGAIKTKFAGTEVSSTESIFVYLANATGLDLVSPPAFMNAVSEGVDPPAQSIATFQDQLESGNVSVLVYNKQTVTPLTTQMKTIATNHNVTIIGITETIQPTSSTFQEWMYSELSALYNALNSRASGG